ncbi:hypothetical protein H2200_006702 [Cladophialophora chaetospira]|uniref:Uncharacterized protein n=1 Tax=Cladophialophora chaetospira TaxID=386627 RepID=A0AA38X8P7_9EURO|nr:hypothetical protein H2200_006702 [Cladophialophora chaetospira]
MKIPPWAYDITHKQLVALTYLGCTGFFIKLQHFLEKSTPEVIFGDLTSALDCGLFTGKNDRIAGSNASNPKETLAKIIDSFGDQPVILPIELRFGSAVVGHRNRNRDKYHYLMRLSPEQQQCELVIVGQPGKPNLVAVIPRHYLRPAEDGVVSSKWHPFVHQPPFAMEYSPFAMPSAKIPDSLKHFMSFHHEEIGNFNIESLFVLCAMPQSMVNQSQRRFLVPSSQLKTPVRRAAMEAFVNTGTVPDPMPVYLNRGGLIDAFGARDIEIVPLLKRIVEENCDNEGTITFDIGGTINVLDLLHYQRDVSELFLESLEDDGESWFVKYYQRD